MCTCFVAWLNAKHNARFDSLFWGTVVLDGLLIIGTVYLIELWIKLPA